MTRRMKRKLKNTVSMILGCVLFGTMVGTLFVAGSISDTESEKGYFERKGIVLETENSYEQKIVTTDGNIWVVYDCDFVNGTEVRVTFDGKKTPEAKDDEIVKIRKRLF